MKPKLKMIISRLMKQIFLFLNFILNSSVIHNLEILYRAVPSNPVQWNVHKNRPSSALFKQENGVSVDRNAGRSLKKIKKHIYQNRSYEYGIVCISARMCRLHETKPIALPVPNNKYHCEIRNNNDDKELPRSKAKKLSNAAKVIDKPVFN